VFLLFDIQTVIETYTFGVFLNFFFI